MQSAETVPARVSDDVSSPSLDVTDLQRELQREYTLRFTPLADYRAKVWEVLTSNFFQRYVPQNGVVLDLGCGWGEFINNIRSRTKYGMDLNPETRDRLDPAVVFVCADCSQTWSLAADSLDVVFTSNFFEHLPNKERLKSTLAQAYRCLKPGGKIICLGPNIRYTGGAYWDFWDHYLPLTDLALAEGLAISGFQVTECTPRFLPYSMVGRRQAPLWAIKLYLRMPIVWRIFGSQFLIVAEKPQGLRIKSAS